MSSENEMPLTKAGLRPEEVTVFGSPLVITPLPHGAPIKLWLMGGSVDKELLFHYTEPLQEQCVPYWAFCWGSGQALAEYILYNPDLVRSQKVVDFGCGSAVVAIAAALSGAREVVAVDCDPMALHIAQENAALNCVELQIAQEMPPEWDVLLASDVLYEADLREWLLHLSRGDCTIIVCEPNRRDWPRYPIEPVQTIMARAIPDVDQPVDRAYIYRLS